LGNGFALQVAHAGPAADTDDSLSNKGTMVNIALAAGTSLNINVMTNVWGNFTISCTNVTATFKVPGSGLIANLQAQPDEQPIDISGCTSFGGELPDAFFTSGTWKLIFKDSTATNEEAQREPNSGDKLLLRIPIDGAALEWGFSNSCVATLDPVTASKPKGSYDDAGNWTMSNTSLGRIAPGGGCPAGMTVTEQIVSASFTLSTPIHDVS
jgi:hypothetical protein